MPTKNKTNQVRVLKRSELERVKGGVSLVPSTFAQDLVGGGGTGTGSGTGGGKGSGTGHGGG
jgi:hypothetical protein